MKNFDAANYYKNYEENESASILDPLVGECYLGIPEVIE